MRPLLRTLYMAALIFCVALGMWIEEGNQRRREQATVASGIYRPAPPSPRFYVDCGAEAREICKIAKRMEKTKL